MPPQNICCCISPPETAHNHLIPGVSYARDILFAYCDLGVFLTVNYRECFSGLGLASRRMGCRKFLLDHRPALGGQGAASRTVAIPELLERPCVPCSDLRTDSMSSISRGINHGLHGNKDELPPPTARGPTRHSLAEAGRVTPSPRQTKHDIRVEGCVMWPAHHHSPGGTNDRESWQENVYE